MGKRECIGDGRVKLDLSEAFWRFDPEDVLNDPKREFHDRIKYLRSFIERGARRTVATKSPNKGRNGLGRLLSYEEIDRVEEKMILEGENIITRKEAKMSQKERIVQRRYRLFKVVRAAVKGETHCFVLRRLTDENRRYISPDNKKYFKRQIYVDLAKLEEANRIYSRGRNPKVFYIGKGEDADEPTKTADEIEETFSKAVTNLIQNVTVPKHMVVDVNVNISFGNK